MQEVVRNISILLCWFSQIYCQQMQSVKGIFLGETTFSLKLQAASTKSLIECAAVCASVTPCISFSYNKMTKDCVLHPLVLNPETHGIPSSEWQYYEVFTGNCNLYDGYHENRNLNICYKLYQEKDLSSELKSVCLSDGAKLMSIDNEEKQQHLEMILENYQSQPTMIGGYRINENWFYEDARPMTYTKWNTEYHSPQPDNTLADPYVGVFNRSQGIVWHDFGDPWRASVICEKTTL